MNEARVNVRRSVAAMASVALLLTGAAVSYLLMRVRGAPPPTVAAVMTQASPERVMSEPIASGPLQDVEIPLSKEVAERAGIVVTTVSTRAAASTLRLPGVVEPNAYRQVTVTPLVAGRIARVSVQLGDRVRRDQALAEVYSPEVAEAQTQYVSARAMLEAHDQELRRTQKLVEIGAASRQELERIHAEHAAQSAGVESARARLQLLGVSTAAVKDAESRHTANATTAVPAPIDGIIVERQANVGLNVDPASKLFTVVDLSNVWVIANLYEQDFSRVSVGSEVTVTTSAYPGKALAGRVSYIDPQVSGDTRTAKLRVEVSNPRHELRLGMYADVVVSVADATTPSAMIPRAAVQTVGDRYVVYLVDQRQPSKFREREVRVGEVSGDQIEISAGVQPGDLIVSEGSFFLRAERDRLGLRSSSGATRTVPNDRLDARAADAEKPALQTARVVVDENGFTPSHLMLRAGTPARITFVRTTDNTCATEIAFPSMKIKRVLPLNQPVVIEITPTKESLTFTCGMEMFKGTVTIE